MTDDSARNRLSPTNDPDATSGIDEQGVALAMSGGGYRAMVFHIGSLWRLYEAGMLKGIDRISSVSGGSITSGMLALAWPKLSFDPARIQQDFVPEFVTPLRALASRTIDADAIIGGVLLPGTVADRVAKEYDEQLFHKATLQSLPDAPRFVINATNVQSGALWRFSKPYMGDWRVGRVMNPTLSLAKAVAASSAFPPVLSPMKLRLDPGSVAPGTGEDLQRDPFTEQVVLSDGGVYDNLGIETVWKRYRTVLVSDAGGKMQPEEEPHSDWARHSYRIFDITDNQVRSLRKRQIIGGFQAAKGSPEHRAGAYWSIRTPFADFPQRPNLPCPPAATEELAAIGTRLKRLDARTQERLINWGYAACDAALRSFGKPGLPAPKGFPYPASGV